MNKLILFLYVVFTPLLLANGGGYRYGIDFTGGIAPFSSEGTEAVEILDEKLDIFLGAEEAKVRVVYKMKNTSDKKQKVKFGFPVENVTSEWIEIPTEDADGEPIIYCKNYQATLNGENLKFHYFKEPFASGIIKPFEGSEVLDGIQGWNVSEMTLKKGEEIELSISYDSVYDYSEVYVSEDTVIGPTQFKYRFSSGAVWKNSIKKGRVTIHLANEQSAAKVLSPVNRYIKKGNTLTWNFEELEPTLKDDLTIIVKPVYAEYSAYDEKQKSLSYYKIQEKWYVNHYRYKVTASSELEPQGENQYSAENLKLPYQEVWSEGVKGSGIGESLSFNFLKAEKISHIKLFAGFMNYNEGKRHLYKANNRVKIGELFINNKVSQTIHLEDKDEHQLMNINYSEPISSIKLTIKEVYKGDKYDDTCIFAVSFLTPLTKEPERYGAR
ncbi:hypothetical protein OAB00_00005 [Akkermansiaceae bacterium]|nr:hypothetical protein [Akkermansiaceae bacterium]